MTPKISKIFYLITVMRYVELNPVRANMVELPSEYRWSSFKHNVGQLTINLVSEHSIFLNVAVTPEKAKQWYLEQFNHPLSEEAAKQITASWLTGTPIGSEQFRDKVEFMLSRKVGLARKGRPRQSD